VRIPRFHFSPDVDRSREKTSGLADPRRSLGAVEACAAAFERVGLRRALPPCPGGPSYLAGARKMHTGGCWAFSDAIQTVRAARQAGPFPSTCATPIATGQAPSGDGRSYATPCLQRALCRPDYLPAPCKGSVLAARAPWGWKGHRGQAAATAPPPTGRPEAESSAEQIRDRQQQQAGPCCGAGCKRQGRSLKGSVSIVSGSGSGRGPAGNARQVWCWKPVPCSGPRPLGRHPEGGLVITVAEAFGGAGGLEGQVQMLETASPYRSFWR